MWLDRVVELSAGERLVAVKNVTAGEECLQAGALSGRDGCGSVMPASLIIEGMAQAGGILVGHAEGFREKVVLAKISRATLEREAVAGDQLRYTARLTRLTGQGAAVSGVVELRAGGADVFEEIGGIELMFSHLDQNMAGAAYPEHNFVFGPSFRLLLEMSGIGVAEG